MNRKAEEEANTGDDVFNFGNVELKASITSCQDVWEKVRCTGFLT